MGWANEQFRQDDQLKYCIFQEILEEYSQHCKTVDWLQEIYDNTVNMDKGKIYSLLEQAKWNKKFYGGVCDEYPQDTTYIGNKAAFMSEEEVANLKEKYL